ncbi:hypothetical protein ACIF83_34135 [Streptomyces sp. NPDC085866]|uniref:hypothetical protein n=1 Tax=Streptomyces sp. NPDC085866 TaxID=3365736 RepID=UPI0037D54C6C
MDESAWPAGPDAPVVDAVLESRPATVAALPVGTRITGEVIGRQSFGVFIRINGVPNAIAPAEITSMPQGMDLPAPGAFISGEDFRRADNHQVRVRLGEWRVVDE